MTSDFTNQTVSTYQEDALDLPLDRDVMFSNHKGVYKKRIEKRQIKVLKKILTIKHFLKEDEKIHNGLRIGKSKKAVKKKIMPKRTVKVVKQKPPKKFKKSNLTVDFENPTTDLYYSPSFHLED